MKPNEWVKRTPGLKVGDRVRLRAPTYEALYTMMEDCMDRGYYPIMVLKPNPLYDEPYHIAVMERRSS